MNSASAGFPTASAADWFRLFGDVQFNILCVGQGGDRLSSILNSVHNQHAVSVEHVEHALVAPESIDMLCFVGMSADKFDIDDAATTRLLDALKPTGWLCLQARSSIPGSSARRVTSLRTLLGAAGFGRVEPLLVYPDFAKPLLVMRPNRKLAATFFGQIYQPRTIGDALNAATVRLLLNLGGTSFAFRHYLLLAQKA